jgi:hypothetical protein
MVDDVPIQPPGVVWTADQDVRGLVHLELYGHWTKVIWFSGLVFLINYVNSLLLIIIRENVSFRRPFKKILQ